MLHWQCKKFDELIPAELYSILQLRNEVFVVEQDCVYQDADNKDQSSFHFMGWKDAVLIAYTRILPPGLVYTEPSLGRVVIAPAARKSGAGKELVRRSIRQAKELFGDTAIRIGAQVYLLKFYTALGFRSTSEIYLEDGIEHIEMIYKGENS